MIYFCRMVKPKQSQIEFIALMAALMSIAALALDALLPALDVIGMDVGTRIPAHNQLLVTLFFLGLGIGPLLFGPISDSIGRKPVVYWGFALFVLASFLCVNASNMETMVAGRILQGIALAAPRTISIAMIRDCYSGDYMARIISFVTVMFILVPIIAPAMGKAIFDVWGWEAIFHMQVIFGILVAVWFWRRQPETLAERDRNSFRFGVFVNGYKELLSYRQTMLFTFIWGFITGSFLVYLSTAQQIFQEQYDLKDAFPYIFAALALTIGTATLLNGALVVRFGILRIVTVALTAFVAISMLYIILFHQSVNPPFPVALTFFALQFFAVGFLFGNLRAMAMEPVGHIAGIGAAITGFIATIMGVPISAFIGQYVTTSVLPMFVGFLVCGLISFALLGYYHLGKKRIRSRA